jgi:carbonic anhydrase/acetyltransferase-like protein (isoleucine patch superfamily)
MALVLPVNGIAPTIPASCKLLPTATVVGDVVFGEECSVWFNAVVRGDVNQIRIGNRVNIQDNAVLHCTYQKFATTLGNNVSVGHNAIVHGCTLHDNVLIGMGAIVMDGCTVESNSIVAAGSVVTQHTHIPAGEIWGGIPARKIKAISPELQKGEIERIAQNYLMYSSWFDAPDHP